MVPSGSLCTPSMCACALQVKNPSVDLPIGIVGSLVVCAFLYALMCVVICLMVPYDQVRWPATAFHHHQSQYWPPVDARVLCRVLCRLVQHIP